MQQISLRINQVVSLITITILSYPTPSNLYSEMAVYYLTWLVNKVILPSVEPVIEMIVIIVIHKTFALLGNSCTLRHVS